MTRQGGKERRLGRACGIGVYQLVLIPRRYHRPCAAAAAHAHAHAAARRAAARRAAAHCAAAHCAAARQAAARQAASSPGASAAQPVRSEPCGRRRHTWVGLEQRGVVQVATHLRHAE